MDILAEIKTCAETVGRDQQAVRDLCSALVHQEDVTADFAAATIIRAIDLYTEADRIMTHLGWLCRQDLSSKSKK